MFGRQLGIAITATVLVAGTLTGLQGTLCSAISSNPKALYLWAEYKMITGDKESGLRLLQELTLTRSRVDDPAADSAVRQQTQTCSKQAAQVTTMMF